MPRGRRPHGTLASLERQLADLNMRREHVIARIRSAVEGLSDGVSRAAASGYSALVVAGRRGRRSGAARKRTMSASARKRLSLAAKRRWAEAKKAGKTRLG